MNEDQAEKMISLLNSINKKLISIDDTLKDSFNKLLNIDEGIDNVVNKVDKVKDKLVDCVDFLDGINDSANNIDNKV
ncbi:hypothetical protein [Flavobacterium sp.]|uniref:hypothetical protein n=1 Tax=Flavobacterium sp. TaxID=239 RepID=UPI0026252523|nr:hypothetical protein [Flavobacterium sp.]